MTDLESRTRENIENSLQFRNNTLSQRRIVTTRVLSFPEPSIVPLGDGSMTAVPCHSDRRHLSVPDGNGICVSSNRDRSFRATPHSLLGLQPEPAAQVPARSGGRLLHLDQGQCSIRVMRATRILTSRSIFHGPRSRFRFARALLLLFASMRARWTKNNADSKLEMLLWGDCRVGFIVVPSSDDRLSTGHVSNRARFAELPVNCQNLRSGATA